MGLKTTLTFQVNKLLEFCIKKEATQTYKQYCGREGKLLLEANMMNEDTTASTSSSGGVKKFFLRISQVITTMDENMYY